MLAPSANFVALNTIPSLGGYVNTGGAVSDGTNVVVLSADQAAPVPYRTTDGGLTWTAGAGVPLPAGFVAQYTYSSIGATPGALYVSRRSDINGHSVIYRSLDSGASWSQLIGDHPGYDICVGRHGNTIAILTQSTTTVGITSTDGGATFSAPFTACATLLNVRNLNYVGGLFVSLSLQDIEYLTSPDGLTWTMRTLPGVETTHRVAVSNGTRLVTICDDVILSTLDGLSWTAVNTPVDGALIHDWTSLVWTGEFFVAQGWNGKVIMSPDGLVWTEAASVAFGNEYPYSAPWGAKIVTVTATKNFLGTLAPAPGFWTGFINCEAGL
jgi:hypothetical protein